jgi:NitT/TauT family transport system permease protein
VSFRIFNYTILKTKGKLKIKKFGIAGTGGQCLMTPPNCPIEELKFVWYNLGGVFFNLLFSAVAIVLWWNKFLSKVLDPFLVVLNALPKTALAPIIIIWVGTGIKGIVCVAVSISLVLTILSSYQYFKNVNEEQILMLKSFNATKLQILTNLVIPSNIGNLINLVKINIGMSWVGVIVGEFIVSKEGIGYLIMYGSQIFKMSLVMMGVLVLSILSFVMYEIVNILEKLWKERRN